MPAFLRGRLNACQLQQAFLRSPPETTGAPRRLSPVLPQEGEDPEDPARSNSNRVAHFSAPPGEDLMDTLSRKLERIMSLGSGITSGASSVHSPRSSFGAGIGKDRKHNAAAVKTIETLQSASVLHASARPSTVASPTRRAGSPRRSTRCVTYHGELGHASAEEVYHYQEERGLEMQAERASMNGHGAGGLGPAELGVPYPATDFPSTPARSTMKNLPPLDDQTLQSSGTIGKQLQPRPRTSGSASCGTQIHICNSALAYFSGSLPSNASASGSPSKSGPVEDARPTRARSWRLPPLAEQQKERRKQKKREKFMTHTGIFPNELHGTPPLLEGNQLNG